MESSLTALATLQECEIEPRSLLVTKRVEGSLVHWDGECGWIEPSVAIDHPLSEVQRGKLFFMLEDTQGPLEIGCRVSFFVYKEPSVIGAMDVRALDPEDSIDNCGPFSSRRNSAGEPGSGRRLASTSAAEAIKRYQQTFYSSVWEVAQPLHQFGVGADQIALRVAKYFHRAAQMPELLVAPWDEAVKRYIDQAMMSYTAAASDTPWFFELDLASSISAGLWELLKGNNADERHGFKWLERAVSAHYEIVMESSLREQAMWLATRAAFRDETVSKKMFKAVQSSYESALEQVAVVQQSVLPLERVERFAREWIGRVVDRAFQVIDDPQEVTEETLLGLFENLVAPFGNDHPFSCIPAKITVKLGRPPQDWPVLRNAIAKNIEEYNQACAAPKSKKRKKG